MSQQSMRMAARLAASGTHPSRTQKSRLGVERRSDRCTGDRAVAGFASRRTEVADVPAVLYGVEEAAAALRLSRSVLYELIRSGRLRTVKQGRRRLVPVSASAEHVASLESGVA
jgi:excisionase family DNA binding protein